MNFSNSTIQKVSVHFVGNKLLNQKLTLSKKELHLNAYIAEKLNAYFLNKFKSIEERFCFTHSSALKYNEIYSFCKEIFSGELPFQKGASQIASHLYEHSVHPKIKGGELYVCFFKDCHIDDANVDAIGIFKTENKSGFFEVDNSHEDFSIIYKEGVDFNKLDKGCIILNKDVRNGYIVSIIDSQSKGEEAQYWKNDFLSIKACSDSYHFTKNFLTVTKDFIVNQLPEVLEINKADQIELLNKSVGYFKENESFNIKDFEKNIFENFDMIKSFRKFGSSYLDNNNIEIADNFEISSQAVKKQARSFKSVIKLDKNFHIYIHGDRDLIEQGYDSKTGKKFYKIYFDLEH